MAGILEIVNISVREVNMSSDVQNVSFGGVNISDHMNIIVREVNMSLDV